MSNAEEPGLYQGALATAEDSNIPGLVVHPGDRRIRAVNETFEQVFGWSLEEIEGVDYREIVGPDDHDRVRALLSTLSFGGSPATETVQMLDLGGESRETKWVGVPNLGDDLGGAVTVFCPPASWRDGGFPDGLQELHERVDGERPDGQAFDPDDEREGSHSSSLWK